MPKILRDPIWQFVGAAFGFAAIILSIILYRTQRRRKALSFDIITFPTPLLSVDNEVKGKVQVLFDGKPVQDVYLVTLKFINSGDVPIVSADYVRPISLSFGESAQILTAEVVETDPVNLEASVKIEATRAVLEPVLLNGGDSITLKFLVSGFDMIEFDGRIVGVKDVHKFVTRQAAFQAFAVALGVLSMIIGGLLASIGSILRSFAGSPYSYLGDLLLEWGARPALILFSITAVILLSFDIARWFKRSPEVGNP